MSIKISQLPAGSDPTGAELVPAVQSAVTVSLTMEQITDAAVTEAEATILPLLTNTLYAVDTGAANAYVLTTALVTPAPLVGQLVTFVPAHVNTGASTVNFDTQGIKNIVTLQGNALTGGELSVPTLLQWTGDVWQILNGQSQPFYKVTPAEIAFFGSLAAAQAAVINPTFVPGCPDRFGTNTTPGTTDMTLAVQRAINSCDTYVGTPGAVYGVTSVIFPNGGPHHIDFNGSELLGIASSATTCIVQLLFERTSVYDYRVNGNFNQNYLCGTWWYNSAQNSQYNSIFGMFHRYLGGAQTGSGTTIRAMIYGALVGATSTNLAQSENNLYGWRTRGCQNPLYFNHTLGRLSCSEPIFVSNNEEWVGVFNWANARFLEVTNAGGILTQDGGEWQFSGGSGQTFAGELANIICQNVDAESPVPIHISGPFFRMRGGYVQTTTSNNSAFLATPAAVGDMVLVGVDFFRAAGTGSTSGTPMIDATATTPTATFTGSVSGMTSGTLTAGIPNGNYDFVFSDGERRQVTITGNTAASWTGALAALTITTAQYNSFEVVLNDCTTLEWRWNLAGGNVRLIAGGIPRYRNTRMQITGSDSNIYELNTAPTASMLDLGSLDPIGYSTQGWTLVNEFGSTFTMTATTNGGAFGQPTAQISLVASGQADAIIGDPTSTTTLNQTALKVSPGERYWLSAYCNISAGTTGFFGARFYTIAGALGAFTSVADNAAIPAGSWAYVDGPLVVPPGAAYMLPGVIAGASTVEVSGLRCQRA